MDFYEKFQSHAVARSGFCLGVDPSAAVLAHWGCEDTPQGLEKFCETLTQQIGDQVALVKPQSAYFERFGAAGVAVLQDFIAAARAQNILVLLDIKRGDIGETNAAYAAGAFTTHSAMGADAITTLPFMGFASLKPFFSAARAAGGYVFVVTASSNAEGVALQQAKLAGGESVSEHIAAAIAEENKAGKVCGAVLGATRTDITDAMKQNLRDALILAPGIGAQGGGYDIFASYPAPQNIIPTSARGVLLAEDFTAALAAQCDAAHALRR